MFKRIYFLIFLSLYLFLLNPTLFALTTTKYHPIQYVKIQNGKLWVYSGEGKYIPFYIKGVGYQPTPIGRHPRDWGYSQDDPRSRINNIFDDPAILNRDFSKLQKMNANTIRIWKGNDTTNSQGRYPDKLTNSNTTGNPNKIQNTVDIADKYGLKVIAGFWVNGVNFDKNNNIRSEDDEGNYISREQIINNFVSYVNTFKNDRAILFWAIGNENNYDRIKGHLMSHKQLRAWYSLVNDMAQAAHDAEGAGFHPVSVINLEVDHIGDINYGATDKQLPALDIWGINAYRGKSFYTLFNEYHNRSKKPLWMAEFGIDAWHVNNIDKPEDGYEDQDTQSQWAGVLWDEIVQHMPVTIGGAEMEYSDEWWKSSEGCVNPHLSHQERVKLLTSCNGIHNYLGYKDGGFPSRYVSKEWFGIMSIAQNLKDPKGPDLVKERKVYFNLQKKWESKVY